MNPVEIREIDPRDDHTLHDWWEVGRAASAERAMDVWPTWEVSRVALPMPREDLSLTLLGAFRDGLAVGSGMATLWLLDNTHLAEVEVYVAPDHRRQGIGHAVLAELEGRARKVGRTTVLASVFPPVDEENAGSLFAEAMGYAVASAEEGKAVTLADAAPTWPPLEAEVSGALGDYRLRVFENHTPDEYVDDLCALLSVFIGSIPTGDLDVQDAIWTPERLRAHEKRDAAAGDIWIVAVALAPDGRLCGFTDVGLHRDSARHAEVGGTLVLPEHRGHRLGLGLKLLSHRRLLELHPGCELVETGNAGVNEPMNAVNERLGYRVVERCLDLQKRL